MLQYYQYYTILQIQYSPILLNTTFPILLNILVVVFSVNITQYYQYYTILLTMPIYLAVLHNSITMLYNSLYDSVI